MIILTGVNRSGTSMVTHLLGELGMDLGPRSLLLGGDNRNPKGYFENKEILFANISLLLGDAVDPSSWERDINGESLRPWERFSMQVAKMRYFTVSSKSIRDRAARKSEEMTKLARKYQDILVNDARFSSTLSTWAEYAPINKIVYCYRHPANVVRSMREAYGLPIWCGYWYWCRRVETFFQQAEGIPLVMVNYDSLFSADTSLAEVRRLYRFMGRRYDEKEASEVLERVVEPDLRNQRHAPSSPLSWVAELWQSLTHYHELHDAPRPFARAVEEPAPLLERC